MLPGANLLQTSFPASLWSEEPVKIQCMTGRAEHGIDAGWPQLSNQVETARTGTFPLPKLVSSACLL